MLVELKNGETLNGHLVQCDTYMNLTLKEVVQTSPEGDKFFRLPECYVRGNNVSNGNREFLIYQSCLKGKQSLTISRSYRSNTYASPMKSSKSSKSNKPQRKRSGAADTAEAAVEIAATVVAAGDKAVVVGEEEVGARHHRRELERGTFMLFTKRS
jgi:hypothetical protein